MWEFIDLEASKICLTWEIDNPREINGFCGYTNKIDQRRWGDMSSLAFPCVTCNTLAVKWIAGNYLTNYQTKILRAYWVK